MVTPLKRDIGYHVVVFVVCCRGAAFMGRGMIVISGLLLYSKTSFGPRGLKVVFYVVILVLVQDKS